MLCLCSLCSLCSLGSLGIGNVVSVVYVVYVVYVQGPPYLWQHEFKEKFHMCSLDHVLRFMFCFYSKYVYFTLKKQKLILKMILLMAVYRNSIVTHHKKCENNSCIAKKVHIRRETVSMVVKKFKEAGETCKKTNSPNEASGENTREKLRRNSRRSAANMAAAEAEISRAVTSAATFLVAPGLAPPKFKIIIRKTKYVKFTRFMIILKFFYCAVSEAAGVDYSHNKSGEIMKII